MFYRLHKVELPQGRCPRGAASRASQEVVCYSEYITSVLYDILLSRTYFLSSGGKDSSSSHRRKKEEEKADVCRTESPHAFREDPATVWRCNDPRCHFPWNGPLDSFQSILSS